MCIAAEYSCKSTVCVRVFVQVSEIHLEVGNVYGETGIFCFYGNRDAIFGGNLY